MRLRVGLLLLALTPAWAQIAKPEALTAPTVGTKPVRIPRAKIEELAP